MSTTTGISPFYCDLQPTITTTTKTIDLTNITQYLTGKKSISAFENQIYNTLMPNAIATTTATITNKTFSEDKDDIIKIEEIVPEKVYKFHFKDGTVEKTVKLENEAHSLKYAAFVALSKKLYRKTFTFEGILYKINNELIFSKKYNKMIDKAIKLFIKDKKDKEKKELEAKKAKERKEQLALKKHNKRLKERQIKNKELAEAIATAMNYKED